MGREAEVRAEVGGVSADVKAILESQELILRGGVRRRFARAAIEAVVVNGDVLAFRTDGEDVRLHMGAAAAQAWAAAIAKPPPSLRAKLGLDKGARALLLGVADDPALVEALEGALVTHAGEADLLVARVDSAEDLAAMLTVRAEVPALAVWVVYPKGPGFGDAAIRTALRAAGLRDSKSSAVSERLTATRYNPA